MGQVAQAMRIVMGPDKKPLKGDDGQPIKEPVKGQWRLRYDAGYKGNKRIQKQITFTGTERQAEKKVEDLEAKARDGAIPLGAKTKVSDHLLRWLETVRATTTAKSHERYTGIVVNHLTPYFGARRVDDLSPSEIQDYIHHALNEGDRRQKPRQGKSKGLSRQSVHHHVRILRQALELAVDEDLITKNPATKAKLPKVVNEEMKVLSLAEIHHLLAAAAGTPLHMLIILAVATGGRRGELLALEWSDWNEAAKTLTIARTLEQTAEGLCVKAPKTKTSRRTIPLPDFATAALNRHRGEQTAQRLRLGTTGQEHKLILCQTNGAHRPPDQESQRFGRLVKRAGVTDVTLHGLRHTFASLHLRNRTNIKELSIMMGHSSIVITLQRYAHLLGGELEEAAARLDTLLRASGDQL